MVCINRRDSLKCTPVCERGHVFYQKFSSRPPTYLCSQYRVDWKITKFIPDCSPVEKTDLVGSCPPGWEAREGECVACPPGMFRDSAPLCQLCGKGSYAETFGSSKCLSCPAGQRTNSLGVRSSRGCRPPVNSVLGRSNWRGRNFRERLPAQVTTTTSRTTTISQTKRGGKTGTGLTHYNSWLREQPQQLQHRNQRFRKHRRH